MASEKNISTAKKRDIAPFKVNGQSHIILQQLSCGTKSKVSFVSNPAQISLKHSSQLTNKTTSVFIRHAFHCVLHVCLCFHIVGKTGKNKLILTRVSKSRGTTS